jgi:hypothetical protein
MMAARPSKANEPQEATMAGDEPQLSKAETVKDTAQVVVESGADHVARIATIIAGAVRDVAREIGDLATEGFEMLDASRKSRRSADTPDDPTG